MIATRRSIRFGALMNVAASGLALTCLVPEASCSFASAKVGGAGGSGGVSSS